MFWLMVVLYVVFFFTLISAHFNGLENEPMWVQVILGVVFAVIEITEYIKQFAMIIIGLMLFLSLPLILLADLVYCKWTGEEA